jgi:hypothetical protein
MSDVALAPLPVPAGAARRRPSPRPEAAPPAGTGPVVGRAIVQYPPAAARTEQPEPAARTGRCRHCGLEIQYHPTAGPSPMWVHLGAGGTFRCRDASWLLLDSYAEPADPLPPSGSGTAPIQERR